MRFLTPIVSLVGVLLVISMITFAISDALPGDAAEVRVGKRDDLTTARSETGSSPQMRKELGLDKPLPVQYAIWLGKVSEGDLGVQEGGGSVGKAVLTRIVPSLELTIITLLAQPADGGAARGLDGATRETHRQQGRRPAAHDRVRPTAVLDRDPVRARLRRRAALAAGERLRLVPRLARGSTSSG